MFLKFKTKKKEKRPGINLTVKNKVMENLKKDEILKAAFAIQPMQVPDIKQPLAIQPMVAPVKIQLRSPQTIVAPYKKQLSQERGIVAAPAPQHKK